MRKASSVEYTREYADLSRGGAVVAQTLEPEARTRMALSYESKPWQSITDVPVEFRDAVARAIVEMRRG